MFLRLLGRRGSCSSTCGSRRFQLDALLPQTVQLELLLLQQLHQVPLQPSEFPVLALPGCLHVGNGDLEPLQTRLLSLDFAENEGELTLQFLLLLLALRPLHVDGHLQGVGLALLVPHALLVKGKRPGLDGLSAVAISVTVGVEDVVPPPSDRHPFFLLLKLAGFVDADCVDDAHLQELPLVSELLQVLFDLVNVLKLLLEDA
mmetsp:Transcript_3436/g.6410  ORF Transcript_3436/g.6410 Transcript_3436/m.6410 type:complete len:203 (-) Transcript_3436:1985-2593(-)